MTQDKYFAGSGNNIDSHFPDLDFMELVLQVVNLTPIPLI